MTGPYSHISWPYDALPIHRRWMYFGRRPHRVSSMYTPQVDTVHCVPFQWASARHVNRTTWQDDRITPLILHDTAAMLLERSTPTAPSGRTDGGGHWIGKMLTEKSINSFSNMLCTRAAPCVCIELNTYINIYKANVIGPTNDYIIVKKWILPRVA